MNISAIVAARAKAERELMDAIRASGRVADGLFGFGDIGHCVATNNNGGWSFQWFDYQETLVGLLISASKKDIR